MAAQQLPTPPLLACLLFCVTGTMTGKHAGDHRRCLRLAFPEADPETRIPTKVKKEFRVIGCNIMIACRLHLTVEHSRESWWEIKQGRDGSQAKGVPSPNLTSGQPCSIDIPLLISYRRKSVPLRRPRISRHFLLYQCRSRAVH